MRARRVNLAGFTLLELILVMLILTIVVGIVAPSLSGFGAGRKNNDMATLIVGLAGYARTQSVTEARTYRLNLDPENRAVWLTVSRGGGFQPPNNDFGKRFEAADGIQLQADIAPRPDGLYVEFQPTGRTDPARIRLTDKLGGVIEVACDSPTELFRIVPPSEVTR